MLTSYQDCTRTRTSAYMRAACYQVARERRTLIGVARNPPLRGGLWHPHRCPLVLAKCQWDRWGSVISSVQDSSNAVSEAFIFATISGIVLGSIGVDSYDVIAIVHVSINRGSSLPTLEMTADAGTLATRAGGGRGTPAGRRFN